MAGLQQVQDVLERVLGAAPLPFHLAFWRGKTRDELVATKVLGEKLVVVGRPEASPLVLALKGAAGGRVQAYFGRARAKAADLAVIEQWIRDGCPEVDPRRGRARAELAAAAAVGDEQHVAYWRAIDFFFHPALASAQTRDHVIRLHGDALEAWLPTAVTGEDPQRWPAYLAQADVAASFDHVRHHQRRLLQEFYEDSQDAILDSLWKFGGNLLPVDPNHPLPPIKQHTMNSVMDWFFWAPYIVASLSAADVTEIDLSLARGWQTGLVADGLLRTDDDRPEGQRMPISDFNATDPDLRSKVEAKYVRADPATLIPEVVRRAKESGLFG
jgi:hypothetical protein